MTETASTPTNAARCSVCASPGRARAESLLREGTPLRTIAAETGLSRSALARHATHAAERTPTRNGHAVSQNGAAKVAPGSARRPSRPPPAVASPTDSERALAPPLDRAAMAAALEAGVGRLIDRLGAMDISDARLADALDRASAVLARLSRMAPPEIGLLQSPAWAGLKARILGALEGHPEALAAVVAALAEERGP